jgi:uncharacterized protein YjiS (DUF1127 family)
MSRYSYYSERAVLSPGSLGVAAFFDRHVVQPVLSWQQKRTTQHELMALDDRQLADIGLSRGEIDGAVFGRRWVGSNRV